MRLFLKKSINHDDYTAVFIKKHLSFQRVHIFLQFQDDSTVVETVWRKAFAASIRWALAQLHAVPVACCSERPFASCLYKTQFHLKAYRFWFVYTLRKQPCSAYSSIPYLTTLVSKPRSKRNLFSPPDFITQNCFFFWWNNERWYR